MNILSQGLSLQDPAVTRPTASEGKNAAASTSADSVDSGKPVVGVESAPESALPTDDAQKLSETVAKLNESVQNIQRNIEFSLDEESGRNVVKVVDRETGDIIRQIPSEDALEVSRNIKAFLEARSVAGGVSNSGQQPDEALGFIMQERA